MTQAVNAVSGAMSAIGDSKAFQNLTSSATGNIVKAVLCIRAVSQLGDVRAAGVKESEELLEDGSTKKKLELSDDLNSAIDSVKKLDEQLMKKAEASLKGKAVATWSDIKDMAKDQGYIALEVQYNPTTLRLSTVAGRQLNYSGDPSNPQVQQVKMPASTTLSFELLFDDTNVQDAFMLEGNPITSMSTGNVLSAAQSAVQGKFSVQRQMEGLLAMLTIPQAKHVVFFWGDMSFRGEVTEVTTNYTMFNKKGYPIRGTLGMSIRQGEGPLFKYENTYWNNAFDRCFDEENGGSSILSQATNNSLVNLKL
ncbi:MAG: hypothetical protein K6F35_03195 [Lachnospiraceae bacterium]|nr:hypothetical protein [Lachnospiraceae bacterium]